MVSPEEYGLADRTSGILLNWYPDGDSVLGSHRHDCWTALFSFGQAEKRPKRLFCS